MQLGPTLKKIMKEKKLTFKKISEKTGIPEATLKGWSQGVAARNFRMIKTLSNELGCTFEYLCLGEDAEVPPTFQDVLDQIPTRNIYDGWIRISVATPSSDRKVPKKGKKDARRK